MDEFIEEAPFFFVCEDYFSQPGPVDCPVFINDFFSKVGDDFFPGRLSRFRKLVGDFIRMMDVASQFFQDPGDYRLSGGDSTSQGCDQDGINPRIIL